MCGALGSGCGEIKGNSSGFCGQGRAVHINTALIFDSCASMRCFIDVICHGNDMSEPSIFLSDDIVLVHYDHFWISLGGVWAIICPLTSDHGDMLIAHDLRVLWVVEKGHINQGGTK
jgi:hypothetical protein